MNISELYGKRIDAAALAPTIDAIFLLGAKKEIYALAPDYQCESEKGRCCILSAKGTEALKDCIIEAIVERDSETQTEGDTTIVFTETAIHTSKGTCLVVTAIFGGSPCERCRLVLIAHKGYPPTDAVSLCDFARCAAPETANIERRTFSKQSV